MIKLLIMRHGQTEWNVVGRYQGQLDPPLNEKGWAQARALADELRGVEMYALYSSPLQRCAKMAQLIAEGCDIPIHYDARLMELNQGEWQGVLYTDIKRKYAAELRRWEREPWHHAPPGGENLAQLERRVVAAIEDIRHVLAGQVVGVMTHHLPLRLIKIVYQQLAPQQVATLKLPNAYHEMIEIPDDFVPAPRYEFSLPTGTVT